MPILISIDDTDNLESPGTGASASRIAVDLKINDWGKSSFHPSPAAGSPRYPLHSYNSAMCFSADIEGDCLEQVINHSAGFLTRESASGASKIKTTILLTPEEIDQASKKSHHYRPPGQ